MPRKNKPEQRREPTDDELADATPRGASFDTEEGRAAQGMRPDIGHHDADDRDEKSRDDDEQPRKKTAPQKKE